MHNDFSKNYFDLFGLEKKFSVPQENLDRAYRDIQSQIHPDKFSHAGEAEKRLSMQWATRANEAYQTLKKPLSRARYLLQLNGVDTQEESNTAMPTAFLMEQMEWREAVIEAKQEGNHKSLILLNKNLLSERAKLLTELEKQIDAEKNLGAACETTRKLRFLEKLGEEIDDGFEVIEK
ncbi:MAG: co-chaperone protein HscB [Pseudomonadota bacterium]|jgi:molecular chaperone HscB